MDPPSTDLPKLPIPMTKIVAVTFKLVGWKEDSFTQSNGACDILRVFASFTSTDHHNLPGNMEPRTVNLKILD
ncbi:hypothetical protein I7I51_03693 [Histoplasma capsulatum]|uniref:Uncharacterized protein n=1 Tax=Ajellomyces capsulatus TaxID=5037 RepID=A0A8A1M4W2_AJECA|nr:hypothetical protein I7I51_03693 [Histoplasma capsulatum]